METSEVLDAAADLLSKPGAWTQGGEAFDAKANQVLPSSDAAVCWCALGAIRRVMGNTQKRALAENALRRSLGYRRIGEWNDTVGQTQDKVVAALRQAAADTRATDSISVVDGESGR